jgi:hypothetical protein
MRFTFLLAVASLAIEPASASLITLTYNESLAVLDTSFPAAGAVWTAQFDLATHPISPFLTPSSLTGPFTLLNVPVINWSGDTIVSIVGASVHDPITLYDWVMDQGPAGGHVLSPGTVQCAQPCSDSASDFQNWGLASPNYGFRLDTMVETWQGVGLGSPAGAPEPASIVLTMGGALGLLVKRYWKHRT